MDDVTSEDAVDAIEAGGRDVSDIINALREAATNPEKARAALTDLGARWSEMTEEQRAAAKEALSGLASRASEMTGEQREQAAALLNVAKDRLATLPEDARTQVNALLSRFTT
jgi:vacuolar-type H+-ATPase subunit E/Vma4